MKYEYMFLEQDTRNFKSPDEWESILNCAGQDGWHVVPINLGTIMPDRGIIMMEREIPDTLIMKKQTLAESEPKKARESFLD